MIGYIKLIVLLKILFISSSCSFKNPGGFFDDRLADLERENVQKNSKLVFEKEKKFTKEISGTIAKKINKPLNIINWTERNYDSSNYIPHLNYENKNQLIYKSKKIGKNKFKLPPQFFEPLILNNEIIFYDFSGNIYNFSIPNKKLKWKYNFYKKRYKNMAIIKKLILSNNNLIIADNVGYIYSLEIETGKLNWAKNYGIPFKSNIKTDDENIFILNQDNKFYSINQKDGTQNIGLETFPSFLKSNQQTNVVADKDNNNVYFITSNGEVYSLNYKMKNLNWFYSLNRGSDLFYSSPIIYKKNEILFSSSKSTYSIDTKNGVIKWELPFSTYLRPIITNEFIFLASKNGFFLNVDLMSGKVLWSVNLFKNKKELKKEKIGDIVSILLLSNKILASTSNGYFLFLDYRNGKIINYTKASKSGFFSNPIIVDKNIYVIDKKMRVLIFN
ncbi:MAG: hypothetical protein CMI79_05165 [Candidatus Pelagibacter sp.]|nr:hypothetical protein [Candidatus Pelagibacter sp.]|tara:strand:+ start:3940 stop:5274 length:1335 start_codon:yes stop_codon:yes gene_type:complete